MGLSRDRQTDNIEQLRAELRQPITRRERA
jgi:hypothetical protein